MEVHFSREGIYCLGWIVIFWLIVVFRESGPGPSQKTPTNLANISEKNKIIIALSEFF